MSTLTRITATALIVAGLGVGLLSTAAPAHADPVPTPAPAPTAPATPPVTPPQTPNPTPAPSPSAPPATTVGEDSAPEDPAWWDVSGQVRAGVSDFLAGLVEAGLTNVMDALGATVLATPDLTGNPRVAAVHTTFQVIANSLLVLFVIAAGYVLVTRDSLQSRHGLRELLPRIFLAGFLVNFAMPICGLAIEITNALAAGIVGQGVDGHAAAAALQQALTGGIPTGAPTGGLLFTLLVLAALVMAVVVVVVFFLRLAMLLLLIGTAPLALVSHALPQTEGLARTWWRAFTAVLGIQLAQAAILLATVRVFLTPDGVVINGIPASVSGQIGVFMAIAMLWIMIKIPSWLKGFVLGPNQGRGIIGTILRTVIAIKTLGVAAGVMQAGGAVAKRGSAPAAPPAAKGRSAAPRPRLPRPGPAAFSHAPAVHAPLPRPAGSTEATFSSPDQPPTLTPGTRAGTTAAEFSHPQAAAVPMRPAARPDAQYGSAIAVPSLRPPAPQPPPTRSAPAAFGRPAPPSPVVPPPSRPVFSSPEPVAPKLRSRAPQQVTPARMAPAPAAFSHPATPQTAPHRPPAPVTPVFSSPPPPPKPARRKKENPA